jgi:hypothetical protein
MLEIGQQLLRGGELVIAFLFTPMPMIAFPALVVIPENAYFINDVCQTVLEGMDRTNQRPGKPPKYEFRELVLGIHNALMK